jgi:hypothetical protein
VATSLLEAALYPGKVQGGDFKSDMPIARGCRGIPLNESDPCGARLEVGAILRSHNRFKSEGSFIKSKRFLYTLNTEGDVTNAFDHGDSFLRDFLAHTLNKSGISLPGSWGWAILQQLNDDNKLPFRGKVRGIKWNG